MQLAVMQEMYAQYLAHYYHYINTLATPPPPAPDPRQEPAPAPAPAAAPQVAQVMNAGGGGAMEEEAGRAGAERDALDWMYLSSRVVLLLSIVYFYSSLGRFVLVACIAGLVYLYQVTPNHFEARWLELFVTLTDWLLWRSEVSPKNP